MANSDNLQDRHNGSFVDTKKMRHLSINLESVGSQKKITVPKNYKGIKFFAITNDCSFTVDEASGPQAPNTTPSTLDAFHVDTNFQRGGYIRAGIWENRQFNSTENDRTVIITSSVATTQVIVEVYE